MAQAPWSKRLLEMVEDGPVDKEVALASVIGLVPPGRAWREYEKTLLRNRNKRIREVDLPPARPTEEGVASGQRQIVVASALNYIRRDRLRQYEENGRTYWAKGRDVQVPTPEENTRRARKAWENMSPEIRAEQHERLARQARENPSERNRLAWARMTPEERSARSRSGWTEERRRKQAEKNRKAALKKPFEERSANAKSAWAELSPEERSARARKGIETRRRRAWFREGNQGQDAVVSQGSEERVQPDQHGREGGTPGHHADTMG
jgi:hypothetical protein